MNYINSQEEPVILKAIEHHTGRGVDGVYHCIYCGDHMIDANAMMAKFPSKKDYFKVKFRDAKVVIDERCNTYINCGMGDMIIKPCIEL